MPHLLIQYKDLTLFDGEVDEFTWADAAGGISVVGKINAPKPGGNALLELLGGKRREVKPEPVEAEETA